MNIRNNFLNELKKLIQKYNVTISAEDHWEGYPECGEDIRITVEFDHPFNDGIYIDDIDLGSYIDTAGAEKLKKANASTS